MVDEIVQMMDDGYDSDIDYPNDKASKIITLTYMLFWSSILALILGCDLTNPHILSILSMMMLVIVIGSMCISAVDYSVSVVSSLLALSLCTLIITSILNAHRYQRIIDVCSSD